jgi:hypothetical protein
MSDEVSSLPQTPTVTVQAQADISNKLWRIQRLYKIRTKDKRLTTMTLNPLQWRIYKAIRDMKPIRYFNLKYRQGGVSTFFLIWWLDDTIFCPNTTTGILSHKKDSLGYLMDIIRTAVNNMPDGLRPELGDDSKSMISFPKINSRIMVALSVRSTALHNLHISEWCLAKDEEVQASIGAAGPMANITGETTGNGVGNYGYQVYQEAKLNENGYRAQFVPWFIQAEYQQPLNGIDPAEIMAHLSTQEQKLKEMMEKDYGKVLTPGQVLWRRWAEKTYKTLRGQEFPETDEEAFRTSGTKFFDYNKLHRLMMGAKERMKATPPFKEHEGGDWVQFFDRVKGHIYAAGADTAEGGGDFSVLKIIDVTDRKEVFVYRARCGVDTFYRVCDEWGRHYNNAFLGVERNNHGHAVLLGLGPEGLAYPNLYKEVSKQAVLGQDFPKEKPGWLTNGETRPVMLDGLKFAMEGDTQDDEDHFSPEIDFYDIALLKEGLTFEEIDGKYQAVAGETDDDIMASAIAVQMYARCKRLTIAGESFADRIHVGGEREAR